jgi:4'-phosphopantetheinyl transferase
MPSQPLEQFAVEPLSDEERQRASRYYRASDAQRMIWRRFLLRTLLAGQLGVSPGSLCFQQNAWGKPSLVGDGRQPLPRFNLSHSDTAVAIVISLTDDLKVGVDVERQKPLADLAGVAKAIMHRQELAAWHRLNGEEKLPWFFTLWAAKEAVLKSVGYGLAVPPQSIIVDPGRVAGSPLEITVAGPDGRSWESEVALFPDFYPYAVAVSTARIGGP